MAPSGLTAVVDVAAGEIRLSFTDNSDDEDVFVVQRRRDGGNWNGAYATRGASVTTFTDVGLAPGTYDYRIVARGSGGCDSSPSNTATGVIPIPSGPGPAPKLRRVRVTGGRKQAGYTLRVDANVKGECSGCRAWELRDGVEPPDFTPGAPTNGAYEGMEVTLSAEPGLPAKRRICVQVENDGGLSKIKVRRVTLVAPRVRKVVVEGGRNRTDPALSLDVFVKRDAVGWRAWEDRTGVMAPAFTPGAPPDGTYRGVRLTLSTDPDLPKRRVVLVQVTGEAAESKVRKVIVKLR